ncbi:hypothetical protein GCM10007938_20970 [Vibrio zhanjiangensis]|uniref:Uncharacterized protein n=1 Tax=Vibrio zhanjiangensis TaxID=1046128 RepID=A0ABQ6EZX8_9VIBR|nr:hypothetical protein GCM10007938_20970 [Vibrio zhanjiangensis]
MIGEIARFEVSKFFCSELFWGMLRASLSQPSKSMDKNELQQTYRIKDVQFASFQQIE